MRYFLLLTLFITLQAQEFFYYNKHEKVSLTPLAKESNMLRSKTLSSQHDYYLIRGKHLVGVDATLLIKTESIETILATYPLTLIKEIAPKIYLLRASDKSQTLSLSNLLSEDGNISFAHPNFLREVQKR